MQKSILTIALLGAFTTALAGEPIALNVQGYYPTTVGQVGEFEKFQQTVNQSAQQRDREVQQRIYKENQQQQALSSICANIMCDTTSPRTINLSSEAAMIANRAESLKNTTYKATAPVAVAATIANVQNQYKAPQSSATPKPSTSVASNSANNASSLKKKKIQLAQQIEIADQQNRGTLPAQQENGKVNAAYGQQTAQTAPQSGIGRLISGDISAALNVASVIAQETGDEKTAKYLLGAGGLVGAGDVAQEIMSGNMNMATAVKGVASVGAIYAATSGNETKVRDFGRGAAVLEGLGAYAGGDGVFSGGVAGNVAMAQQGAGQVANTKTPNTNTGTANNSAWTRAQQAAQKQATVVNCAVTNNITVNKDCVTASTPVSGLKVPVINSFPVLR